MGGKRDPAVTVTMMAIETLYISASTNRQPQAACISPASSLLLFATHNFIGAWDTAVGHCELQHSEKVDPDAAQRPPILFRTWLMEALMLRSLVMLLKLPAWLG